MKKKFGLNDMAWERLLETSSHMIQSTSFPSEIVLAPSNAVITFASSATTHFQKHPESLSSLPEVLKFALPDIVTSILSFENHGKEVDLHTLLVKELGLDVGVAEGAADAIRRILLAVDQIHHCLHPLDKSTARARVVYAGECAFSNPGLASNLDAIVKTAKGFAESDLLREYLATHEPQGTLQRFQRACVKLCVQAAHSDTSVSLGRLKDRMAHAVDVAACLVKEIATCHGFLDALVTMTDTTRPGAFPALLGSMCRRAALNFARECTSMLRMVCPEAAETIAQGLEGDPVFSAFRLESIVKYQALIFDTWQHNPSTTILSQDLLFLAQILRDFQKTPPFDALVRRTPISRLVEEIEDCFPNRIIIHPIASHRVLATANEAASMPPPPKNLGKVYQFLIKQQAANAVRSEQGYDVNTTLSFFRDFYRRVQPPVFSSGILALRVYQVYRDVCVILGLTPSAALPERAFFEKHPSETLVPDPFHWTPAPLVDRRVADAVAACRDMVLAYTQTPQLPEAWVRRLLEYLCGQQTYTKHDISSIFQHIETELDNEITSTSTQTHTSLSANLREGV